MSGNGMSTKENHLQLPTQFPSTSSSDSESETEYNSEGNITKKMTFHLRKERLNR